MFKQSNRRVLLALVAGWFVLLAPFLVNPVSAHTLKMAQQQHSATNHNYASPTTACNGDGCNGLSPVDTGCIADKVAERSATSDDFGSGLKGTVTLYYSSTCQAIWSEVVFNALLPAYNFGDGGIYQIYPTDKSYFCDDSGGSGYIAPGETTCHTPMLGHESSQVAYGVGGFLDTRGNTHLFSTPTF